VQAIIPKSQSSKSNKCLFTWIYTSNFQQLKSFSDKFKI
jgi:hypothetical protein